GRVVKWVGTAADIHDQKEATERLLRAQRQSAELLVLLDTLLSKAPIGFAFHDTEFRFVRVNDALAQINGLPAAAHLGRTAREAVRAIGPHLEPIFRRLRAGGEPVTNHELRAELPAASGRTRHWLGSYYPVCVGGEVIGIGVIVNEVTEQRRLEELFRQAQKME